MELGELFKRILGKKSTATGQNGQETEEQLRSKLAGIEQNIGSIHAFQGSSDSTGATRAADAERLEQLKKTRAELQAKLPPQPVAAESPTPIPIATGEAQPATPTAVPQPEEKAA